MFSHLIQPLTCNYKIMVTLTRERVIEAAPLKEWRRAKLYELLEIYPQSTDTVFCEAWEALIKCYRYECKEIGETRAFWGLVYRLLTLKKAMSSV